MGKIIEFDPKLVDKHKWLMGYLPMPESPGLEDGESNRLKVNVQYLKDHRAGRGIYLSIFGETFDGKMFSKHALFSDPSFYIKLEDLKRFNAKKLEAQAKLVASGDFPAEYAAAVEDSRRYYEEVKDRNGR